MRTTRDTSSAPRRRRLLAAAAVGGVFLITATTVAGCSGSDSSSASSSTANGTAAVPAPAGAPSEAGPASAYAGTSGSPGSTSLAGTTANLVRSGQQIIYTAQLTVRAADVRAAVTRATSIATADGGYVSGEQADAAPGHPSQSTATLTLKIPVAAYQVTLAALSGTSLGTQLTLSQQAQDVTQKVADTNSRVASDEAAIAQLRLLLKHAGNVSSLLSVQNQVNSEETDLESMLAQQTALDHETSYATLTLTLFGPKAAAAVAKKSTPPGLSGGASRGWHAFRTTVSWLLTGIGAAAPFAAVVVVLAGLGWLARRRVTRRRATPAA